MPGPRNKKQSQPKANTKANPNAVQASSSLRPKNAGASPVQCLTLEEDEFTRCGQPATEGYPKPERCKVHHGQYRILYKKYKDASKVVDDVKGSANLPTEAQIASQYPDWHAALEKARWACKYLEAIRVEKVGREIHQKRFFLKVDDGHRRRLKLLEKEMVRAVEILDTLEERAYQLYVSDSALSDFVDSAAQSIAERGLKKGPKRTPQETQEAIREPDAPCNPIFQLSSKASPVPTTLGVGDEDLIQLALRNRKEKMILAFKFIFDSESFINVHVAAGNCRPETEHDISIIKTHFLVFQQFARRIIFHEPTLFMKSLEKVSFKDLILSDEFSVEDLAKFVGLFTNPLAFPLKWFKDAVLDALAISRYGTAANIGNVENRFPLLGGWVYNRAHTVTISNEAWWHLLNVLAPPGNMENRFVRLCNSFDDLIGFLSFGAFGLVPCPNFCITPADSDPKDFEIPRVSRNHLSLSGIIVADMVGETIPPAFCGPIPTPRRATKPNCVVWAEIEARAYMFGAVRNEQDPFVDSFLRELRARPDLFQVVLRADTAPGRSVEMFGSGPLNGEALPAIRSRQFEAPASFSPLSVALSASNHSWTVLRSAVDVLYGTGPDEMIQGYLTNLARDLKGWFFRFKTFPVTYFVILDTIPNRDRSILARNVSWAALRAGGYAKGEYTLRKYAVASDKLFDKCSRERLGWMPKEMGWKMTRMEDRLDAQGL